MILQRDYFDVDTPANPQTLVALLPGPDIRAVGGSARARNSRIVSRAGASLVDVSAMAGCADAYAIVVPPHVLIDLPLFAIDRPAEVTRLESAPGVGVVAGPARDVARHLEREGTPNAQRLPCQRVSADALMDVSTSAAQRRATWRILQRTAKASDGWVSQNFNRPISRRISFVALSCGLKAGHASTTTLVIGLATALFALRPGYLTLVITGILFQLASVLDGVDGEMARATLTESEGGARLDAVVDQVTYIAVFVGVTVGWAREGGGVQALAWTTAIAVALALSLLRGARFVARYAPDASFVFIDRSVRRAARDTNRLALRLAAAGFALLRRDLFAVLFLIVSFIGRRAMIPGMVAFGILLANVTLSVYRRELAEAALAEHPGLS